MELYQRLVKYEDYNGRTEAINIELLESLAQSIITNWDYKAFQEKMLMLESLNNQPQMGYNIQYEY